MKKKSDKVIILLLVLIVFGVLAWIVPQGNFEYGTYYAVEPSNVVRPGIFDIVSSFCSAIYTNLTDILFILLVGGCYGVLSKMKRYRKLVDKTAELVGKKPMVALLISTFVMALITSMTSHILFPFVFVPFIITVFLRSTDRFTAFNASFGGILVGFMGLLFGSYSLVYLKETTTLEINYLMGLKVFIFIVTYALYSLFAVLHLKKEGETEDTEYDLFETEELDESKVKASKKTKVWPFLVVFIITAIVLILGHIDWRNSFNVNFFTEQYTKFQNAGKIGDVAVFSTLLGNTFRGFGDWNNLIYGGFIFFVVTAIFAMIEKMKVGDFFLRFEVGIKKVLRLAIVYSLVLAVYVMIRQFPWVSTFINKLFGEGKFNILTLLIIAFIASAFTVLPAYGTMVFGSYIAGTFVERIAESMLIWHIGQGFAMLIAPTSIMLVLALTYLDISYKEWLKHIWKFTLSFLCAILLILIIKVYM